MQCSNNFKQLGLAFHTYHDAGKAFPAQRCGPSDEISWGMHGFYIALLPYFEQGALYSEITSRTHPACPAAAGKCGTASHCWPNCLGNETPFNTVLNTLGCPSDGSSRSLSPIRQAGGTNYMGSIGDSPWAQGESEVNNRGFFGGGCGYQGVTTSGPNAVFRNMSSMSDGTSNTIMMSEAVMADAAASQKIKGGIAVVTGNTPGVCSSTPRQDGSSSSFKANGWSAALRGSAWCDGRNFSTGFQTILPPNAPSCNNGDLHSGWERGYYTASSNHTGGVNGGLGDGSVQFISDTISSDSGYDTPHKAMEWPGDTVKPSGASPWGVWGAYGSVNGGESKAAL